MSNKSNIQSRGIITGYNRPQEYVVNIDDYVDVILNLDSYWRWYDFTDVTKASYTSNQIYYLADKSFSGDPATDPLRLTGDSNSGGFTYWEYATASMIDDAADDYYYYGTPVGADTQYSNMYTSNIDGITYSRPITVFAVIRPGYNAVNRTDIVSADDILALKQTYQLVEAATYSITGNDKIYKNPDPNGDEITLSVIEDTFNVLHTLYLGASPIVPVIANFGQYFEFIILLSPSPDEINVVIEYLELKYGL